MRDFRFQQWKMWKLPTLEYNVLQTGRGSPMFKNDLAASAFHNGDKGNSSVRNVAEFLLDRKASHKRSLLFLP
jgi:hypothetical protein